MLKELVVTCDAGQLLLHLGDDGRHLWVLRTEDAAWVRDGGLGLCGSFPVAVLVVASPDVTVALPVVVVVALVLADAAISAEC